MVDAGTVVGVVPPGVVVVGLDAMVVVGEPVVGAAVVGEVVEPVGLPPVVVGVVVGALVALDAPLEPETGTVVVDEPAPFDAELPELPPPAPEEAKGSTADWAAVMDARVAGVITAGTVVGSTAGAVVGAVTAELVVAALDPQPVSVPAATASATIPIPAR